MADDRSDITCFDLYQMVDPAVITISQDRINLSDDHSPEDAFKKIVKQQDDAEIQGQKYIHWLSIQPVRQFANVHIKQFMGI